MRRVLFLPIGLLFLLVAPALPDEKQPAASADEDSVKVEVRGTLAVAGKIDTSGKALVNYITSTGVSIGIKTGVTWELHLSKKDLRQLAEKLDGKRVVVTGKLVVVTDFGGGLANLKPPKYIISVKSLKAADGPKLKPKPDLSEPTYEFKPVKTEPRYQHWAEGDSVTVVTEGKRTVFVISNQYGIGGVTIRLKTGQWPREIALRFQHEKGKGFHKVESFALTTDRLQAAGRLVDGTDHLSFSLRNAEGTFDDGTGGRVISGTVNIRGEKGKDGIEAKLPANLLVGSKEVTISWIDVFRR
jgi:hypothetical protein